MFDVRVIDTDVASILSSAEEEKRKYLNIYVNKNIRLSYPLSRLLSKSLDQKYIFKFNKEIGLPLVLSEQSSGRMAPSTNKQEVSKIVIILIVIIILTRYVYILLAYIILDCFTVSI